MAVYKFRVTFEDYDEVSRDIEIKPTQTFKDLHLIIQQSIKFDAAKPASFFMSTDNWTKGREISLEPKKNRDGSDVALMETSVLNKFIIDPHQKIYYIFDVWTFYVELIKIVLDADKKATFPRCVKTTGEAPPQYRKVILPAAAAEVEDELLDDLDDEDEVEEDSIVAESTEEFDEDHGFEGVEGEEADEADADADDAGEAFEDEA
jgi:hypothetical protein